MRCDYCLEDLIEGAAVCPHCTREQLWSVDARLAKAQEQAKAEREANFGCVLKTGLVIAGIVFAVFVFGSISANRDRQREIEREAHEAVEKACAVFIGAGDYSSADECAAKADLDLLKKYTAALLNYCKNDPSHPLDWNACMVDQRRLDRNAGMTIDTALQSEKYMQLLPENQ